MPLPSPSLSPHVFPTLQLSSLDALTYSPCHPTLRVQESELSVHKLCWVCDTVEDANLCWSVRSSYIPLPNTVYHFKPSYYCELLSCLSTAITVGQIKFIPILSCLTVLMVILFITVNNQHTFSTATCCLQAVLVSTSLVITTPLWKAFKYCQWWPLPWQPL